MSPDNQGNNDIRDSREIKPGKAEMPEMMRHALFVANRVKEHKMPEKTAVENIRREFRISLEEAKKIYAQAAV